MPPLSVLTIIVPGVASLRTVPLPSASPCVGGGPYQNAVGKGRHVGGHYQFFPRSGAGQDGQVPPLGYGDNPGRGVGPGHRLRLNIRVAGKMQGLLFYV